MKRCVVIISIILLWGIIAAAGFLRYYKLDAVPYGYHVDELCMGVLTGCMASENTDAHRVKQPVFANMNYGTPKPPTYFYPAMWWSKLFGYDVASLRAFGVTLHLVGLIGLFFLSRYFFGFGYATVVLVIASISPWVWVFARVAFESFFSVGFLVWGMYVALRFKGLWAWALAGALFAGAMYSYPPVRLQMPIFLCTFIPFVFYWRARQGEPFLSKKGMLLKTMALGVALIAASLPLILKTLSGEIQGRFNTISIFSSEYLSSIGKTASWQDLLGIFWQNYALHFTPDFLFKRGDPSLVHSTGHHGILGYLDMMALGIAVLWVILICFKRYSNPLRENKVFLLFLVFNIAIGFVPVALTFTELPNSLRIVGAWPFWCLLSGFLIWQVVTRCWGMWLAVALIGIVFAVSLFKVYFEKYPQESKGMFGFWTLEEAKRAQTDEDWLNFMVRYRHDDYHTRYFLMQYRKVGCSESKTRWDAMKAFLESKGMY